MQLAEQNRLLGSEGKNTLLPQTAQSFPYKVRLFSSGFKEATEIAALANFRHKLQFIFTNKSIKHTIIEINLDLHCYSPVT